MNNVLNTLRQNELPTLNQITLALDGIGFPLDEDTLINDAIPSESEPQQKQSHISVSGPGM